MTTDTDTLKLEGAAPNDRSMLTDWIGDFLAYWRDSGISEQDAADAIICVLAGYPALFEKEIARPCPDAVALYETLANPNRRGRLCGCCDALWELHQSSKK